MVTKLLTLLVESRCLSRDVAVLLVLVSAPGWKDAGGLRKVVGGFDVTQSGEGNLPAFGKSAGSVKDIALLIFDPGEKCVRLGQFACVYGFPCLGLQRSGLQVVTGQRRLRDRKSTRLNS